MSSQPVNPSAASSSVVDRLRARVQAMTALVAEGITPPLTTVQHGVEAQKQLNFAIENRRKKTQGAGSPERAEEIARELLEQMNAGQAGGAAPSTAPAETVDQEAAQEAVQQLEEVIDGPPSTPMDDDAMGALFEDANAGDEAIDLDLGMSAPARQVAQAVEPVEVADQVPTSGTAAARMRALLKESGLG